MNLLIAYYYLLLTTSITTTLLCNKMMDIIFELESSGSCRGISDPGQVKHVEAAENHSIILQCPTQNNSKTTRVHNSSRATEIQHLRWWKTAATQDDVDEDDRATADIFVGDTSRMALTFKARASISPITGSLSISPLLMMDSGCYICYQGGRRQAAVELHIRSEY